MGSDTVDSNKARVSESQTRNNTQKNKYTEQPILYTCMRPQSSPTCTLKPDALRTLNSTLSCAKCTFFLHLTLTDITIYLTSLPGKCYVYIPWIHISNTPIAPE